MSLTQISTLVTLVSALSGQVNAQQGPYFVLGGGGQPLVLERVDPILHPGQAYSQHVHSVVGGNAFAPEMDFEQTQKSTCATVNVKADKSNYWMPNLYFHVPSNGSFIRVPEQPYHKIYYKYGNGNNEYMTDIQEFPEEFRMIAGDATVRSYDANAMGPYGSGLGWVCHGPDKGAVGFPRNFTSCPFGFAAAITMPSCWNGKDFDVSKPSAHMAYPVADGITGCPETHRVARFPQIFVEYWFNTDSFDGLYTEQDAPWVLAMGDPTGYAFHVDFINGWEVGSLNATMKTCRPGNTGVPDLSDDSCFGKLGGTFTDAEMKACRISATVHEDVGYKEGTTDGGGTHGGVLNALPGCQTIEWGPGRATLKTCPP